uniref:Uncharacterized protein n=1 Tax=Arundo donax TaxID=35708 RepID=A0A0A9AJI5_ARUDO
MRSVRRQKKKNGEKPRECQQNLGIPVVEDPGVQWIGHGLLQGRGRALRANLSGARRFPARGQVGARRPQNRFPSGARARSPGACVLRLV